MALSGVDDYVLTRDEIIASAFEDIGVAKANEPLESEDIATAARALNTMALSWKAHGLQLWKRGRYTLSSATTPALTSGTYQYELGGTSGSFLIKPMRLLEVSRKDSSGNEVDLNRVTLNEYESLPNKTTTGTPVNYYYEPQRLVGQLYLWPGPDATFASNDTIEIVYQSPFNDMDVGNEDVDFPNEWYDALTLGLAYRLSGKYGTLDYRERALLRADAMDALELAKGYDVEDGSVYFQPDFQGMR